MPIPEERQPLLPSHQEAEFCHFLSAIVWPATRDFFVEASTYCATKTNDIAQTFLDPHRYHLAAERCHAIEQSLKAIARYIHHGEFDPTHNIARHYENLHAAINAAESDKTAYQQYAIRVMQRYQIGAMFSKMVTPAPQSPVNGEASGPLSNHTGAAPRSAAELSDDATLANYARAATPLNTGHSATLLTPEQTIQHNLETLFAELALLDEEMRAYQADARAPRAHKVLGRCFKALYLVFTLAGSASGFAGGTRVATIIASDIPEYLKLISGFLGYTMWVLLFLSFRDTLEKGSLPSFIFGVVFSISSAFFARLSTERIVDNFLHVLPEMMQTALPWVGEVANFSINIALNLGLLFLILKVPKMLKNNVRGIYGPMPWAITSFKLGIVGLGAFAGSLSYASSANIFPMVTLPKMVNLLLSIFGNIPDALMGALYFLTGMEPWAFLTNPQFTWIGSFIGLFSGSIGALIFYGFLYDTIIPDTGDLHTLDHKILYGALQCIIVMINFMIYSKLGIYLQGLFIHPKAWISHTPATPRPLFPLPPTDSEA